MDLNKKIELELDHVKFNRSRFRRYVGNIGEMVAQEVLLKEGFQVWLLTPYFPNRAPFESRSVGGGLIHSLSYLYKQKPGKFRKRKLEDYENKIKALKTFFGDKLEAFKQYTEKLGVIGKTGISGAELINTEGPEREYIYTPDLVAKKDEKIYVVEIKTGKGIRYLKEEKLKGLMLAKEYGLVPLLVTLNVNIEVTDLILREL